MSNLHESYEKKSQKYAPLTDVDECSKKWSPVTNGIDSREVSDLCAWNMEREAKYLQERTDHPMAPKFGGELKYIFPVIRKAVIGFAEAGMPNIADGEEQLAKTYQGFVNEACEAVELASAKDRGHEPHVDWVQNHELMRSLGARLAGYTLSYPRVN